MLSPGGNTLALTAKDLAANESVEVIKTYVLDTSSESIGSLSAVEEDRHVRLSWPQALNAQGDFAGYLVYRSLQPILSTATMAAYDVVTSLASPTYLDTNVFPGQTYYYGLATFDTLGNRSPDPVATAVITLAGGHKTSARLVIGNQVVPSGAAYELFISPSPIAYPGTVAAGVKTYQGSVIANGVEYFWLIHFTPVAAAPAAATTWGAYVFDSWLTADTISPFQERLLDETPQASVLKLMLNHETGGDVFEFGFNTSTPLNAQIDRTTDWTNWTPLLPSGTVNAEANYKEPAAINPAATYRVRATVH